MNFIKNMSIRAKLMLISALPVLGLIFYLQASVREELNKRDAARQLQLDVVKIEKLSGVIHEMQKERALMVSYVSSKGNESKEGLSRQRELTDITVFELNRLLNTAGGSFNNLWLIDSLA